MRLSLPVCVSMLVLAGSADAVAQEAELDSLRASHAYVRLTTVAGDSLRGRIERLADAAVWLRFQPRGVSVASIRQIDARVYHSDPLGNGIALGAGIGAVSGILLSNACIGCETGQDSMTLMWGGLISGAFFGLVTDLAREKADWKTLWRKR